MNSLRVGLTIYRSSLAFMDSPMQVGWVCKGEQSGLPYMVTEQGICRSCTSHECQGHQVHKTPCSPPLPLPKVHCFEAARCKAAELARGLAAYQPPGFEIPLLPEELQLPMPPSEAQQELEGSGAAKQEAEKHLLPTAEPLEAENSLLAEAPVAPALQVP